MTVARFHTYTRADLKNSANPHILVMKEGGWTIQPNRDVIWVKEALLRDATSCLTFNGHSFKDYLIRYNTEMRKLNPHHCDLDTDTIEDLEPTFKLFLKEVLFAELKEIEFEAEYKRLTEAYLQPMLAEGAHVITSCTCKKIMEKAEQEKSCINAHLSKKATHDLTYQVGTYQNQEGSTAKIYQGGTFKVVSKTSSFVFNHMDAEKYKTDDPIQMCIPGKIISCYQLNPKEKYFSFDHFVADSYSLNIALFKSHVDVPKLLLDDALDRVVDVEKAIPTLYEKCKNYKEHLKQDLIKGLEKTDPVLASQLNEPYYSLNPTTGKIDAAGREQRLDHLINDPKMEEKIKHLQKPERLAIKKYKAITEIEKNMDSKRCPLNKAKAFVHGVYDNMPLLRSSRDSYFVTFIKGVAAIFSLGKLTSDLFATKADTFINSSFCLLNNLSKKAPSAANTSSQVSTSRYTP